MGPASMWHLGRRGWMVSKKWGCAPVLAGLFLCLTSLTAQAETRGYVISWLATASYYTGDVKMGCPGGKNGGVVEMHARELEAIGFDLKAAVELQRKQRDTDAIVPEYRDK